MNFIDLGSWTQYTPSFPEDDPRALIDVSQIVFFRDEAGRDWYETVNSPSAPKGPAVALNEASEVVYVGRSADQLDPRIGSRILVLPDLQPGAERGLLWKIFAGGAFVDPPPKVPALVSKAQAQMALYNVGLLDQLEAVIAAHPYRPVRIWYESANDWERTHPYIALLGPELGLSDAQIDQLFKAAAAL